MYCGLVHPYKDPYIPTSLQRSLHPYIPTNARFLVLLLTLSELELVRGVVKAVVENDRSGIELAGVDFVVELGAAHPADKT